MGRYSASLGRHLPVLRENAGLSQAVLAARSGVGIRTIKEIEAGRAKPELETLLRLQQVLGLATIEEFFGEMPTRRLD